MEKITKKFNSIIAKLKCVIKFGVKEVEDLTAIGGCTKIER